MGPQLIEMALGNLLFQRFSADVNTHPGSCEHSHEGIDTEKVDFPAHQIADPGLFDLEQRRGFDLSHRPIQNHLPDRSHKRRPDSQVLCFLRLEAEIGEHVSGGTMDVGPLRTLRPLYCL